MPDKFQPRAGAELATERLAQAKDVILVDDDTEHDVLRNMTRAAGELLPPAVRMEHLDSGLGPSQGSWL